jgi:hypothetical protein
MCKKRLIRRRRLAGYIIIADASSRAQQDRRRLSLPVGWQDSQNSPKLTSHAAEATITRLNGVPMNRRKTLKGLALLAGGNLLAPSLLADFLQISASLQKGNARWKPLLVSPQQALLLGELVEVILPATDTPGAREAFVHVFIDLYVKDCYPKAQQEIFLKGLDNLDAASRQESRRPFLQLSKEERLAFLKRLEKESWEKKEAEEKSFIKMLKRLTLLGFFSSQPGATKAAEYVESPGPFQGCIDLKSGQKVHAL